MLFRYFYGKIAKLFANSRDLDQMSHSDLDLHCLLVTHFGISRLKWVNNKMNRAIQTCSRLYSIFFFFFFFQESKA